MRVVFLSNYFNHHQLEVSNYLFENTDGDYLFVSTTGIPAERIKLGYQEQKADYVVKIGEEEQSDKNVLERIDTSDVLIVGGASELFLENRKKKRRLIFRYLERPLKRGFQWWKYPVRWIKFHKDNPRNCPIYLLCASAFTAYDYSKFGMFREKCFKWGYFPETKHYDLEVLSAQKKRTNILWCGRFLDWKHPDDAVLVAKALKDSGCRFNLNIIGTGVMEEPIKLMIKKYDLSDCVHLLGSMHPEQVRNYMETTGIFLFTSDRKEGWGAVLNEAMNSACAVVASHSIGSVPFLIKNKGNGLIYKSGDTEDLCNKVLFLLVHHDKQKEYGEAAYRTITEVWNARVASDRLLVVSELLKNGKGNENPYKDGPLSPAAIIKEDWFNE